MRRLALLAPLALSACASSAPPAASPEAKPLWREDLSHLSADRAVVRSCLERQRESGLFNRCEDVVQVQCDAGEPGAERRCDWRAIAAWEDEMSADLAALNAKLDSAEAAKLGVSQRAWSASMLADIGLNMDHFAGGSLSGPIGAKARATAVAQRVIFLEQFRTLTDEN